MANVPHDLSSLELENGRRRELEEALHRHEYKMAEKILVDEADRDPKSKRSAKLLELAGALFFLDGQYLDSAIAWKRAEAIAPLEERNRFTLAMAYVKLNRRDWARPELEKLVAVEPANALYLYWLARLDYDAQRYTSAITRLQKAVELDPKMVRAYDTLGLCYDYLGKFDDAVKNYHRAVALNRLQPRPSPWPHVDLAITLVSINNLAEAESNLHEAIGYDSRLPQAHYELGRLLEKRGSYETAVESLRMATELEPRYAAPHYLLGRIYERQGRGDLAKAEMEQFQKLKKGTVAPSQSSSSTK